jgi:hypothetical protein
MKKNRSDKTSDTGSREQLNTLMEAVALIIARRQMKRRWSSGRRASLPSII